MNKRPWLLIAALFGLVGMFGAGNVAGPVSAEPNGKSEQCPDLSTGKEDTTGDPSSVPYEAPSDKVIVQVCAKAGTTTEWEYFEVSDMVTEVSITHSQGSVSHWSVKLADKPQGEEPPTWEPPQYPPFNPEECVEYRLAKATSTWDGETGTWSEWKDWPGADPLDWGAVPDAMTGHHGGEHEKDGDQHFAYVVADERPITTGECAPEVVESFVRVTSLCVGPGIDPGIPEAGSAEAGEYIIRIRHEGGEAPVDYNLQIAGSVLSGPHTIGDGEVQYRTLPVGSNGVKAVPVGDWVNTYTGTASTPKKSCEVPPETVTPQLPKVVPPTCDAPGEVVLPEEMIGYDWVQQEDGTYLAVPDEGYVFPEGFDTTFDPGDLSQLTGEQCETRPPRPPSRPPVTPPENVVPELPEVMPPTCDAAGEVVLPEEMVGYDWVKQEDGTYLAVPDEGYVFPEGFDTTFDPGDLGQLTGEQCETPQSQPPVTPEPPVRPDVGAGGPLPPAQTPDPAPSQESAQPAALPVTGTSSWALALSALATLLAGLGLLRLGRRPDGSTAV